MAGDRKMLRNTGGVFQPVEGFVRDISNLLALDANDMMMGSNIRIEAGPLMTIIDFLNQPGFFEDGQGVVNRIGGNHRLTLRDLLVEIFGRGVSGAFRQRLVNRNSLWRTFQSTIFKPALNVF